MNYWNLMTFLLPYLRCNHFPSLKNKENNLDEEELSLFHKPLFSSHFIFEPQCCRPLPFQTKNSVKSNNLSLIYQRFTISGCIRNRDFKIWFHSKKSVHFFSLLLMPFFDRGIYYRINQKYYSESFIFMLH